MRHKHYLFLPALLAWAILFIVLSEPLRSQTKHVSMENLSKTADIVAVGKVTGTKSEWDQNKTRIFTLVTLQVSEYVKGGEGNSLTITTPGGEVGDVGELYTHVPTFRPNEEVVVFLEKEAPGRYRVAGGDQGKYNIEKDPQTGRLVVAGSHRLEDFTAAVKKAMQN